MVKGDSGTSKQVPTSTPRGVGPATHTLDVTQQGKPHLLSTKPGKTIPDFSEVNGFHTCNYNTYESASSQQAEYFDHVHYRQEESGFKLQSPCDDFEFGSLIARGGHLDSNGSKTSQQFQDEPEFAEDGLEEDSDLGVERRGEDEDSVTSTVNIADHEAKDVLLPSGASCVTSKEPSYREFQRDPIIIHQRDARKSDRDTPSNRIREFSPNGRQDGVVFDKIAADKQSAHEERYKSPGKGCNAAFHLNRLQKSRTKQDQTRLEKEVREKYHPSVGKILLRKEFMGTCLAVGRSEKRYILTAYHVLRSIGETFSRQYHPLEEVIGSPQVVVIFGQASFRLQPEILQGDVQLDYSIVELIQNCNFYFPPSIKDFGHIADLRTDKGVVCIGFQDGRVQEDFKAALYRSDLQSRYRSLQFNVDELQDIEKELSIGKCLLATSLIYGSSGGLVASVNCDDRLALQALGVILKGYPNEYYLNSRRAVFMRKMWKGCQLVELALPFDEILKDVKFFHPKLAFELFGDLS